MANCKVRQEINFTNVTADPVDSIEASYGGGGIIYIDSTAFNNETTFFEFIAKNSDSSARSVTVYASASNNRTNTSLRSTISVPGNTRKWTLIRGACSFEDTWPYYHYYVDPADDSYISIKAARVVILQNAAQITATQSQFEIGCYLTIIPAAASTWYYIGQGIPAVGEPKQWKYEASKWDASTMTVKLGITFGCEDDKESYRFGLYDLTDSDYGGGNLDDLITGVTTETPTYYESSNILSYLEDGHDYCLAYWGDDDKDDMYFFNAKIIVTLSDATSIDKFQTEYLLANELQEGYQINQTATYYDPSEWDDSAGGKPTFWHENSQQSNQVIHLVKGIEEVEIVSEFDTSYIQALYGATGTNEAFGQSFQVGYSFDLKGICLVFYVWSGTPTDNIYLELASTIDGAAIRTSPDVSASLVNGYTLIRFIFGSVYTLSASTTYYFRVFRDGSRDTSNYVVVQRSQSNPYSLGSAYERNSGSWSALTSDDIPFALINANSNYALIGNSETNLRRSTSALTMPASAANIGSVYARYGN